MADLVILHGIPQWLLAAVAAPFVGSFLGVLAMRLPAGKPVVWGRSRCAACGTALGVPDLVPVVSWLASRGKCRHCGAAIGRIYPAIELAALAVPLWAASETSGWVLWATCFLGWALLTLAVMDSRSMVLADAITLPLITAGLLASWAVGRETLYAAAIGAVAGFVSFALIGSVYHRLRGREGLGLGDAKLLAAGGAWLTWPALPSVVALAAISGLATTLVRSCIRRSFDKDARMPFGPHLGVAIWLIWLYGPVVPG